MSRCGCVERHVAPLAGCPDPLLFFKVLLGALAFVRIACYISISKFPNFNSATTEVWEWIGNCIPHFDMDRGVRSWRWWSEGLGVNSTADIGCFQETHCGLLDLAFSPADKHSQQISSQTFSSQFLPLGPIRLKWYCCCLRLSVCPSVCLFVCDCWSISMTKLVQACPCDNSNIFRIFLKLPWNILLVNNS